jgi:hypothetical protein
MWFEDSKKAQGRVNSQDFKVVVKGPRNHCIAHSRLRAFLTSPDTGRFRHVRAIGYSHKLLRSGDLCAQCICIRAVAMYGISSEFVTLQVESRLSPSRRQVLVALPVKIITYEPH